MCYCNSHIYESFSINKSQNGVVLSLVHDMFIRTNRHAIAIMFICPSGTGVHCDHTVHFSTDLSSWLHSPVAGLVC